MPGDGVRSSVRRQLLEGLAAQLPTGTAGCTRVGVDGVDGSGKTRFAAELADAIRASGRPVVTASVDAFHRPRAQRYRQGADSPRGYFEDSYDYAALRRLLLDPLGRQGDRWFVPSWFDHRTDQRVRSEPVRAEAGSVLIVDGIFLHRDELAGVWDFSVFLHVPFEVSFARMAVRDGTPTDPDEGRNRRYADGQRIYLSTCRPQQRADVVVDNSDLARPFLV